MSKQELNQLNIKELETLLEKLTDNDSHLIGIVADEIMLRKASYRLNQERLIS
ncbi:hypothetical protein VPHK460_0160 [Vibrio phage K460]